MAMSRHAQYNALVIVTSDTCYVDPAKDQSGEYVREQLVKFGFGKVSKSIAKDDKHTITSLVKIALDDPKNVLLITVGGTGLCPRDVTPEATSILYEKHCGGISTALHMTSLRYSPYAALSRLTAGIVGNCLIVNFPGSLKACRECFACLEGFLAHALEQVLFDAVAIKTTHTRMDRPTAVVKSQTDQAVVVNTGDKIDLKPRSQSPRRNITEMNVKLDILLSSLKTKSESEQIIAPEPDSTQHKIMEVPLSPTHHLKSPYQMIDYNVALRILGEFSQDLCKGETQLIQADSKHAVQDMLGNILAEDLHSLVLVPPSAVSKMDGYVINLSAGMKNMLPSLVKPQALLVDDLAQFEAMHGSYSAIHKFICYQINTGGRLPEKDFAIVPFEKTGHVILNETENKKIVPIHEIKPGLYIRPAGSDLNYDDFIPLGTLIGPVELSLIQSMGHKSVRCLRKPPIGIISTGDELVEALDFDIKDLTKVVDINNPLLKSLLVRENFHVTYTHICRDNPGEIASTITKGLTHCDVLLVTGGASMGTKDFVKAVISDLGGILHFGRINIKPGKPAGFSSINIDGKRKFIFTLPGNPVSAYVTSLVLVLPFLKNAVKIHFNRTLSLDIEMVGKLIDVQIDKIEDDDRKPYVFDGRLEFLRAKLIKPSGTKSDGPYSVAVSIKQQSSRMLSFLDCDCLIMIAPDLKDTALSEGSRYQALRIKF